MLKICLLGRKLCDEKIGEKLNDISLDSLNLFRYFLGNIRPIRILRMSNHILRNYNNRK